MAQTFQSGMAAGVMSEGFKTSKRDFASFRSECELDSVVRCIVWLAHVAVRLAESVPSLLRW